MFDMQNGNDIEIEYFFIFQNMVWHPTDCIPSCETVIDNLNVNQDDDYIQFWNHLENCTIQMHVMLYNWLSILCITNILVD